MGEFFHGWRRKAGCVTLMMACVLMCGWIRSFVGREYALFLCDNDTTNRLVSFNGKIDWERFHQEGPKRLSRSQFSDAETILENDKKRDCELKWTFLGFGRGEYRSELLDLFKSSNPHLPFESLTQSVWIIPYWSVVLPLTLLSAYLILWKPRKAGAGQICQPSASDTAQQPLPDFR